MRLNSVNGIKPLNNKVLIKIPEGNKSINLSDGTVIKIDISFTPGKHVDVFGEIAAIPDRLLTYKNHKSDIENVLDYETDIDIRMGDKVFFDYLSALLSLGYKANPNNEENEDTDTMFVVVNNLLFMFIDYQYLYVAIRNESIIMLNGYILVEPVEKVNVYSFSLPGQMDDAYSGIVRYTGNPNKSYMNKKYSDTLDIEIGDKIIFRKYNNQLLENPIHSAFPEYHRLYKMQRRQVVGKITI